MLCLVHADLLLHACHVPRGNCRIMHHVDLDACAMYKQLIVRSQFPHSFYSTHVTHMRNLNNGAAFDDYPGSRAMPTGNYLSSLESRAASCDRTCLLYTKLPRPKHVACHYSGRLLHSCCQILCLSICLDLSCLAKHYLCE